MAHKEMHTVAGGVKKHRVRRPSQALQAWGALKAYCPHIPKRLRLGLMLLPAGAKRQPQATMVDPQHRAAAAGADADGATQDEVPYPLASGAALIQAAAKGSARLVRHIIATHPEQLVNYQDSQTGLTALAVASQGGHVDVMRLLLLKGADAYLGDHQGVTPVMRAARAGHEAAVRLLVDQGEADVYQMCYNGGTALMSAAASGSADCIRLLLQVGADVRQASTEHEGTHALLEAAAHGRLDAVKALLQHPATRINQTDKHGNTALLLAARQGDLGMVQVLLHAGAKAGIPHFASGRTPLMEAACEGHAQVVAALLKHMTREQIQALDRYGRTAFALAGRPPVRALLQQYFS